jgi:contactin associated protein-like 2
MGESGLIFYAHNKTSEDYLALHLQDSKLYLTLNTLETYSTFSAGSLLDDNFFHYVELSITDSQMLLTLDSVEASSRRLKDTSLKFVDSFVIGESHNNSFEAFRGCLGNIAINRLPIELKSRKSCPRNEATSLMTFFKAKSFLKIDLKRASNLIQEVAFEFKTFEADSLLLYHGLKAGFIRIYLEDSRLKAIITASDDTAASHIELDSFDLAYNDGEWHSVRLAFTETSVNLTIDREILDRRLASKISLRGIFLFGGGLDNEIPGFVGCVKNLQILGSKLNLRSNTVSVKGGSSAAAEVLEDGCVMDDKCSPNPCQHGGICKQNSHEFFCDCEGSGYSGSVCHTSLNYRSCMDFALAKPMIRYYEYNMSTVLIILKIIGVHCIVGILRRMWTWMDLVRCPHFRQDVNFCLLAEISLILDI